MFFSLSMKKYMIDASFEKGLQIALTELNIFIGIIILTSFNSRTTERDYWSNDRFLKCPIVRSVMSRNRFLKIKKGLKCSKTDDESSTDFAWRVRALLELFISNVNRVGCFQTAISGDEMMINFMVDYVLNSIFKLNLFDLGLRCWHCVGLMDSCSNATFTVEKIKKRMKF